MTHLLPRMPEGFRWATPYEVEQALGGERDDYVMVHRGPADEADMAVPRLNWSPLPGHHPGQSREDVLYVEADYRGMHCELFQNHTVFLWSFYDHDSHDPDLAVSRGASKYETNAEWDLCDYIDGYIYEKGDRP